MKILAFKGDRDFGDKVGLKISNKGKMPVVEKK